MKRTKNKEGARTPKKKKKNKSEDFSQNKGQKRRVRLQKSFSRLF